MVNTAVYLDSVITEYYNGSAWVSLTSYVVGDIHGNGGLGGWKPENRVAVLGTLDIILNNKSKLFSPMGNDVARGLNTLTGFTKGAKIRVRGIYSSSSYTIWTGRISKIDSDDKNWGDEQTRVTAVDWMEVPSNYPMKGATMATNQTIDQVMALILARLSLQPEATSFDIGSFTFPQVFDGVKNKTMALSELTKIANSELGYIYTKQDGTLKEESALSRIGTRALDTVLVDPALGYLLKEDGGYLLLEDGGKIILDEMVATAPALSADAESYNILLDPNSLLNSSTIRAFPIITDTSLKVVFNLTYPIFLQDNVVLEFSGHYTDPNGLGQICATNQNNPIATTDYLCNTKKDGSGVDKTANLAVTATFTADTVYFSMYQNSGAGAWVTKLNIRAWGIYYGNSIESIIEDAVSQAAYGYVPFQFDQRYQKTTALADQYGLSVIEEYKNPKSRITKMKYLANLNKNHMMCFLLLTVGALILGTEDRSLISNHYYITDRAFTIKQGGIVYVEYGLKQNDSYLSGGVNPLTIECSGKANGTDGLNYGYLPLASNLRRRSLSIWIYMDTDVPDTTYYGLIDYGVNYILVVKQNRKIKLYDQQMGDGAGYGGGDWTSTNSNVIPLGAWTHVLVTHDTTAWPSNSVPIIYVNGSVVALTENTAPSALFGVEDGMEFVLGNSHSNNNDFANAFDGKLFDARVYNRILSAAEVTTLYNTGTPDKSLITSGLVFQGPACYSDFGTAATLAGHVLTTAEHLIENALRVVGMPHGSLTIRANP